MSKAKKSIAYLLSIPQSLYLNLKLLPFKSAVKLPVMVHYATRIISLDKGSINLAKIKLGTVRIGFQNVELYDAIRSPSRLRINGKVNFEGSAYFGNGTRIMVDYGGILNIGDGFRSSAEIKLMCCEKVTIKENALIGWEAMITDSSFHLTQDTVTEEMSQLTKPVEIGRGTWICAKTIILPGTVIPDGCVVGAGSVCNKDYKTENALIAGNPAVIKKLNTRLVPDSGHL